MVSPKEPSHLNLGVVDNQYSDRNYKVKVSIPEFSCICPRTGQPDYAVIDIHYIPDKHIVELKSLKLYMASFRNEGAFHEDNTNRILQDISSLIKPRYMSVTGYWKVRGGIVTTITTKHIKKNWKD